MKRIDSKKLIVIAAGFVMAACSGGPEKGSDAPVDQHAAALSTTAGDLTMVYPIIVPLGLDALADIAAAKALSVRSDEICATLEIDPSLLPRRPNGTGCPRPEGPAETWGAQ